MKKLNISLVLLGANVLIQTLSVVVLALTWDCVATYSKFFRIGCWLAGLFCFWFVRRLIKKTALALSARERELRSEINGMMKLWYEKD